MTNSPLVQSFVAHFGEMGGVVQKVLFSGNTGATSPPSEIRDFLIVVKAERQAC